jgi:hypothetical protein
MFVLTAKDEELITLEKSGSMAWRLLAGREMTEMENTYPYEPQGCRHNCPLSSKASAEAFKDCREI